MRSIRAAFLALALGACTMPSTPSSGPASIGPSSAPTAAPSPAPAQSPDPPGPAPFSAARAMDHVRKLAGDIGPRTAPSKAYRRAARYVRGELREMGYRVTMDAVPMAVGRTWNVSARWPGATGRPVLLGAHLDTVEGSPGANDNASGVAVILEVARSVAGTALGEEIRFVTFGGEEVQPGGGHHYGSLYDAARSRPRAMVSVDMIGLDRDIIVAWLGTGSRRTVKLLLRSAREIGIEARERVLPDVSDHGPYERAGVPSGFLWTGDEPNHHEPTDVVTNVQRGALARMGRLLLRFLSRN
ncbi:MAG TPA: M28 family peptidase, partial [Actinomycetota bacterium]